jgi:hypothetical protein
MSEIPKPTRIVEAYVYGGEELLLLKHREGYFTVPQGEVREDEKKMFGLINIALWRILTDQLGLDNEQIDYLKNRPFKYLGVSHGYREDHYHMAVNRSVGYELPVRLPENGNYAAYGWYNLFHLPEGLNYTEISTIQNLKKALVHYHGRNKKREY